MNSSYSSNRPVNNNNEGENDLKLISKIERVGRVSDVPAIKLLGIYSIKTRHLIFSITSNKPNKIARSMYAIKSAKNLLTPDALKSLFYAILSTAILLMVYKSGVVVLE